MLKTYQYKLYPNAKLSEMLWCFCPLYNAALEQRIDTYRKAFKRLAKYHRKAANQRKHFAHTESCKLVNQYHSTVVEDLNIKGVASGILGARSLPHLQSDRGWQVDQEGEPGLYKPNLLQLRQHRQKDARHKHTPMPTLWSGAESGCKRYNQCAA